MIVHPFGSIIGWFIILYLSGMHKAYREEIIAKHSLPLNIKRILFLGLTNKFTLSTIIAQIVILITTAVTLIICYTNPGLVQYAANIHKSIMIATLLIRGFFTIRISIIENKQGKEFDKK